jgi:vitamin B12 transporter
MKPLLHALCVALVAARLTLPAHAAEVPAPLDAVTTTATRTEVAAAAVLAAQIVITRSDIERAQANDLAELLRFHSGLEIGRNGGPGQVTSVFTRGGNSNHTLVMVDGVVINPGSGFAAAVQNLSPDLIERIEIIKGPRSTLYGSSAIAGVIHIITRRPDKPFSLALSARGGADDTRGLAGELGVKGERARFALHAESTRSDGYAIFSGLPDLERGFERDSLGLEAGARLGALELSLRGWHSQGAVEYISFGTPGDQDFRNSSAALELAGAPATRWTSRLGLTWTRDDIEQKQPNFLGDFDHLRSDRPRLDWFNSLAVHPAHTLSAGLSYEREAVDTLSFGTRLDDAQRQRSAVLQDEFVSGAHRAVLGVSWLDHQAFGGHTTWNAEYGYSLSADTRLVTSAGSGFRAPSIDERFGFFGNPDLEPEKSRSLEAGLRQALGAHWQADLRLFRNDVDRLIVATCIDLCGGPDFFDDVFQNRNLGETRNEGGELSFSGRYSAWSARLAYLRQNPRSRSAPTGAPDNGRELLRRAEQAVTGALTWTQGRYSLGAEALGSGERADFGQTLPGYALLNLNASAKLGEHFTLRLRGENVLDADYQTAAGYPAPGAGAYVTLRWER